MSINVSWSYECVQTSDCEGVSASNSPAQCICKTKKVSEFIFLLQD